MQLLLSNDRISLRVDTRGAEMTGLNANGTEYLWQADPAFWDQHAPILFPFVGRLTNGGYRLHGRFYPLAQHGFAASSEFSVEEENGDRIALVLRDSEETRASYPFSFRFSVIYELLENTVRVTFRVENRSNETMPFGIGGHPGFRVPLCEGEAFTDYTLEFDEAAEPDRVGFTEKVYLNGKDEPYPLVEGRFLPLSHDLFDEDAVILKNMAHRVTLRSRVSGRGVTVSYPFMPYLGLWHRPRTTAPYLCIEPWNGLPSRQDVEEEITCKSDLVRLPAGQTYETTWTITVF